MDDRERIRDPRWVLATVRVCVRRLLTTWRVRRIAHHDEDDLVNYVLMTLYANDRAALTRFDPARGSAQFYLFFMTKQRLTELRRKHGRREELERDRAAFAGAEESAGDDPEALLGCREIQQHLEKKLEARASPVDRQIFRGAFLENMTNLEIAAQLKIPGPKGCESHLRAPEADTRVARGGRYAGQAEENVDERRLHPR